MEEGINKKNCSNRFKIILQEDYFSRRDTLSIDGEKKPFVVVPTPTMHLWERIKKFFGMNYSWYYIVKPIKEKKNGRKK